MSEVLLNEKASDGLLYCPLCGYPLPNDYFYYNGRALHTNCVKKLALLVIERLLK
jgi:hypothetical protein